MKVVHFLLEEFAKMICARDMRHARFVPMNRLHAAIH